MPLLATLLAPALLATPALAGTPADGRPAGHDAPSYALTGQILGSQAIQRAEVLDLDLERGLVAWKLTHSPNGEWGVIDPDLTAAACAYAGMDDPYAGVTLALFDLSAGAAQTFEVYPAADEPAQCASHEASAETLAAAKAAFAAAGLDIARRPAPILPGEGGGFTFEVDGRAVAIGAWSFTAEGDDEALYAQLVGRPPEDFAEATTWGGLIAGEAVLFSTSDTYVRNMAGYRTTTFTRAWQQGDRVIFEVEHAAGDMRSNPVQRHTLTPVVTLGP